MRMMLLAVALVQMVAVAVSATANAAVVYDFRNTGQTGAAFHGMAAHSPSGSPALDTVNGVTITGWIVDPTGDANRNFQSNATGLGVSSFVSTNNDNTIDPSADVEDPNGNTPERPEIVGLAFDSDVRFTSMSFAGSGLSQIMYRLPLADPGFDSGWQTADLVAGQLIFDPHADDVDAHLLHIRPKDIPFQMVDLVIDTQPTLPEPTSVTLWGMLMGLGMLRVTGRKRG